MEPEPVDWQLDESLKAGEIQLQDTVGSQPRPRMLARMQDISREAGTHVHEIAQDFLADVLQPVPRSLSQVMRTFKDLTQSVVEVIRMAELEFCLPQGTPRQAFVAEVKMYSPTRRMCRRRRDVYADFTLPLEFVDNNVLKSRLVDYDCRVASLNRRRGKLFIDIVLKCCTTKKQRSSRRLEPTLSTLARFSKQVPVYTDDRNSPDMVLQFAGLEAKGSRLSFSHHKLDDSSVKVKLKVLDSTQVFDISRCRPSSIRLLKVNEWKPTTAKQWGALWESPWRDENVVEWTGLLHTMMTEMKNDAVILYQTLFAQNSRSAPWHPELTKEEEEAHDMRVLFLKRLILCLAACKLTYCTEENGTSLRAWPFPLASALAHGSRILVRLDGVPWQDFVNLLLFEDPKRHKWTAEDVPSPFKSRWAATHAIALHENAHLCEKKLKPTTITNLTDGFLGHHLGMDLPLGGLGNRAPGSKHGQLFIGPSGVPFMKPKNLHPAQYIDEIQHGHLYMRWDDFGVTHVPVLTRDTSPPMPTRERTRAGTPGSLFGDEVSSRGFSAKTFVSMGSAALASVGSAVCSTSSVVNGEWLQLPTPRSVEELQTVLKQHGRTEEAKNQDWVLRLFHLLARDSELALQSNGGHLRLRGVLIYLVLDQQVDGEEQVLVHVAAEATPDSEPSEPEWRMRVDHSMSKAVGVGRQAMEEFGQRMRQAPALWSSERQVSSGKTNDTPSQPSSEISEELPRKVEDLRVPAVLRRRHESWKEALERLCHHQLQLASSAIEKVVKHCRRLMTAGEPCSQDKEMCIYLCSGPVTLCHHHQFSDSIPIEYQAYRFPFTVPRSDRPSFGHLCQADFETIEQAQNLDNFGGGLRRQRGSIARTWAWMSRKEALEREAAGLELPEERLHIVRETEPLSAVLFGIENSAPGKEGFFSGKHGMSANSKDRSPFGARKWRDYRKGGHEVPADIGGMHMHIDHIIFDTLAELLRSTPLSRPSQGLFDSQELRSEKQLFQRLLSSCDSEAEVVLREHLSFGRPVLHQTGTLILDGDVVERGSSMQRMTSMSTTFPTQDDAMHGDDGGDLDSPVLANGAGWGSSEVAEYGGMLHGNGNGEGYYSSVPAAAAEQADMIDYLEAQPIPPDHSTCLTEMQMSRRSSDEVDFDTSALISV